ncbi:Lrp/AsnC family transcriptional regulator [Stakelama tenebrarum]|uniref:Lrp/AsnC family transcriptional regulator n=1 Tax=Stakelama tenebrarum TaxID=2711215 RepID=A0A6G6Y3A9_9SPHN|nr:Lrp/AsnC family transcriptional regulator [Sphingosinithalassobacter tenebrarum]QIG79331.1 Lrp/AsnC family transcriptional regulator [Sphingosinithalassobacter tenebrarum]
MRKIDKTDRRLLQAIQENALLTAEQLGEACGLSPTAALKRRKKLRSDGVIERDSAVVSPRALGFDIMALVMVTLDREDRGVIDRFNQDIRNTPQITQAYYITGDADFVLFIVARDMDEYDQFTREFFYDRHPIKTFKTCVVLSAVKSGGALPIPD